LANDRIDHLVVGVVQREIVRVVEVDFDRDPLTGRVVSAAIVVSKNLRPRPADGRLPGELLDGQIHHLFDGGRVHPRVEIGAPTRGGPAVLHPRHPRRPLADGRGHELALPILDGQLVQAAQRQHDHTGQHADPVDEPSPGAELP